jgi:site-specific DNA-methyltransferase (adenine-specific)
MPYYERGNVKLFHGDCREILPGALGGELADMVFADPPYNLSNDGITCHAGKMVSVNKGEWDKSDGIHADHQFVLEWLGICQASKRHDMGIRHAPCHLFRRLRNARVGVQIAE